MESQPMLWVFCLYLQVIFSPGSSEVWKAKIVSHMRAMTDSCVVIPCTFTYPGNPKSATQQRAIWFEKDDPKKFIYDEDQSKVDNSFKKRTKLVGNLGELNCSLEIDHIKDHDNGEFCFRIEIPKLNQYSFKESCVVIKTFAPSSDKQSAPTLSHPHDPVEGSAYTIICSVYHTCPSHVPTLTWSHGTRGQIITMHKDSDHGRWETQSILTFIPKQEDDHQEVSCTVTHRGNKPLKSAIKLNVKSKFSVLFYIIIPLVVAAGTAIVFGVLIMFMRKKYKNRITALQSGGENGLWSRLSRMSRRRHPGNYQDGTSRPERRSNGNNSNMDVGYRANNEVISTGGQKASKPRCPSPKSNPKSSANSGKGRNNDNYNDFADANIYGNL
ncbi:myelin-associated glycoprotein-like isoform X2 [Anguilla anguilla]|uniref:myelin-associated glycoprotein-like isoform X2 n=1 Tax=Anguilla anguilla TaxID=7936 RepID=UPI0015ACEA4C|nr:myelin-associated glycoprotein-like isoform X2 [Anguilla anguilla]